LGGKGEKGVVRWGMIGEESSQDVGGGCVGVERRQLYREAPEMHGKFHGESVSPWKIK